jgi:hypothetical protein
MRTHGSGWLAVTVVAVFVALTTWVRTADADPKSDIQAKSKAAMESYDLMDYDAAKKLLNQALGMAKKAKLDKDAVAAKVHLQLGIAAYAAGDHDAAKASFVNALQIDKAIQIDAAYKSAELSKLLDEARSGGGPGEVEPAPADHGCAEVKGLQHTIIDVGTPGTNQPIELQLGADIKASKVAVMYRIEGTADWVEGKLTKQGECKYTGQIPSTAMKGALIHYYVAAYDANNKLMAGKGSAGSPNILELTGTARSASDDEDPINGKRKRVAAASEPAAGEVRGGVVTGGKQPRVLIQVAGGTGLGYVTGVTEAGGMVESCCIGQSLVVLTPELGYYVSRKLSISLAARIGLPIGANVEPHATVAPGGLVRVRYAFSNSGDGLRVIGQVGGGVMRNTIKLDASEPGMDTDIVAQGPLLLGAGLGYSKKLGGGVSLVADLSALAGIAVVSEWGTSKLNHGIGADLSLGLAFGF